MSKKFRLLNEEVVRLRNRVHEIQSRLDKIQCEHRWEMLYVGEPLVHLGIDVGGCYHLVWECSKCHMQRTKVVELSDLPAIKQLEILSEREFDELNKWVLKNTTKIVVKGGPHGTESEARG